MMRRREFITLLGGGAVMPIVARAQQAERMRRIGILLPAALTMRNLRRACRGVLQGLQQSGWTIGRNLRIDTVKP